MFVISGSRYSLSTYVYARHYGLISRTVSLSACDESDIVLDVEDIIVTAQMKSPSSWSEHPL